MDHAGGYSAGGGEGAHIGDSGSLYSGFWRPLGGIVGSAQTNALPAVASSWLLLTLPGAALPLELPGTART